MLGWVKVEELMICHQRNKFKGGKSIDTWKKYFGERDGIENYYSLELDHIIPFCISEDSSEENLQLLTHKKHLEKSIIDRKILRILRETGFYEKITHYSLELLRPKKEVVAEFIRIKQLT